MFNEVRHLSPTSRISQVITSCLLAGPTQDIFKNAQTRLLLVDKRDVGLSQRFGIALHQVIRAKILCFRISNSPNN